MIQDIFKNERTKSKLDKACFLHDMAYGDFRDLPKRIVSDKVYHVIEHLILLKIQNMMDIKT